MLPAESLEEGPEMVYATRMLLRKILDEVQKHTPMDFATTKRIDDEDLEHFMNAANSHTKILENWRSVLALPLAWEDKEPPSIDPLKASLRAEYYNGMTKSLRPYLEITRYCKCFSTAIEKPSAGQQGLIEVVRSWVQAALSSIIAFDRIGAVSNSAYEIYESTSNSPVMLSNPVKTLHA
jgi:hypothetical protein